ncbi:MAG: hypothetical protein KC910_25760 [Candidatus Eremiobacteraeota bacterium]|nr:hypothetical protein [Candidatus Eremiobacteraeota bacterium]
MVTRHLLTILLLLTLSALADTWALPDPQTYTSPNGLYQLEVVPANITNQLQYFEDLAEGNDNPGMSRTDVRYCRAYLTRKVNGKAEEIWSARLANPVAPTDALVADDGQHVVTFDNWHEVGYGPLVVVVYGPQGQLLRQFSLEDILAPEELANVPVSTSSRWWLKGAWLNRHELYLDVQSRLVCLALKSGVIRTAGPDEALGGLLDSATEAALEFCYEHDLRDVEVMRALVSRESLPLPVRLWAAFCVGREPAARSLVTATIAGTDPSAIELVMGHLSSVLSEAEAEEILLRNLKEDLYEGGVEEGLICLSPSRLKSLLRSPEPTCQLAAVEALRKKKDITAVDELLEVAASSSKAAERAVDAAIELAGPQLAARLAKLGRARADVRDRVALFFYRNPSPAGVDFLIDGLGQASFEASELFRQALTRLTNTDLGPDAARWRAWRHASELERRRLELEAGDFSALARLTTMLDGPSRGPARRLLLSALGRFPRCRHRIPIIEPWRALEVCGSRLLTTKDIWDIDTGVRTARTPDVEIGCFNSTGQRFFTEFGWEEAQLWSIDGQMLKAIDPAGPWNLAEFSPDGEVFATAGAGGLITVFASVNGEEKAVLEIGEPIHELAFVPNKPWVLCRGPERIHLMNWEEGKEIAQAPSTPQTRVMATSSTAALVLQDVAYGQPADLCKAILWRFNEHPVVVGTGVTTCNLDGEIAVVGRVDGRVTRSDGEYLDLPAKPKSIATQDDWRAVIGSDDQLYLWKKGGPVTRLRATGQNGFPENIVRMLFLSNNRMLVVYSGQGLILELPPVDVSESATDDELRALVRQVVEPWCESAEQ